MTTRMCDLSPELIGEEIFKRIPITYLRAVRSTCKLWESLTKNWILGKKATTTMQPFLGFITMDSKICSLRFNLHKVKDVEVDLSIKHVELLNEFDISKVFQCDGLLLLVTKDNSRLLLWNPYLGKTMCIEPRINFNSLDSYALGYEYKKKKPNHKILGFLDSKHISEYEIYDLSSNSWRVLDVTPDCKVKYYRHGVSLKGNTYFLAQVEKITDELVISDLEECLLCFDFTTERFGPRLPLTVYSYMRDTVTLSCVREEKIAGLYQHWDSLEIWVNSDIKHNTLSWTNFLKVDMGPLDGLKPYQYGSFFIDEEEKIVVVFDLKQCYETISSYNTAFIIGDNGYVKSISLGEVPNLKYNLPRICYSSYLPSLVQIKQRRKRKHLDDVEFSNKRKKIYTPSGFL